MSGERILVVDDEPIVRCIRYGSILHDVGKIGVSGTILCKPGSLTPVEFAEIREHSGIGARIVALVDAYDAMSTDRPCRSALAPEAIRE